MPPSILERDISNLERSLDSLEGWLAFMTALVVLGLVIEYWHELPEAITALRRAWSWKPLCIVVGGILITVGVAGELVVQRIASDKETALRKANDKIFTGLNIEAAQARRDASAASERASKADERASKNEKEAAQLRNMAEAERLERIKLEAIVAPRSLSLDQQAQIAAACSGFRGHRVLLTSYGMDGEAAALGAQIISALQAAHVTVLDGRASIMSAGGFDVGIHIRNQTSQSTENDFISGLGNALSSIGKLQVSVNDPWPRTGAVMGGGGQAYPPGTVFVNVMIGVKPLPILPPHK